MFPTFAISLMVATPLIYVASCGKQVIHVESVSIIDGPNRTMFMDQTLTLTCAISPADATNKNVTWSSEDTNILDVDTTGKVVVKGYGETNIVVTTQDGKKQDKCLIKVVETPLLPDRILDDVEKWATYTKFWDERGWLIADLPYSFGFYCKNTIGINRKNVDRVILSFKKNDTDLWKAWEPVMAFDATVLVEGIDYDWANGLGYVFTPQAIDKFFSGGYFGFIGSFNDTAERLTTTLLFHEEADN